MYRSFHTHAFHQRLIFLPLVSWLCGLPWWLSSKESACSTGDSGSIPGSGRSPGGENGNPLWYSCLESPMDRGAWLATVLWVERESDTTEQLNTWHTCTRVHTHTHTHTHTSRLCAQNQCKHLEVREGRLFHSCEGPLNVLLSSVRMRASGAHSHMRVCCGCLASSCGGD